MILNDETRAWALNALSDKGYELKSTEVVQLLDTPWSYVGRIETNQGSIYLKQTPALIGHEARIIETLKLSYNTNVPEIVSSNGQLHCFLMKDAGKSLRETLKQSFNSDLVCDAIQQFASLQIDIGENSEPLLNSGVPDWGLDKLPLLFENIVKDKRLLQDEGLSESQIQQLVELTPMILNLCLELSEFGIKETLVQPDCNDNNMLVSRNHITLIDLGEIVISHPFFSLINFLYVIKKHHALKENDEAYRNIFEATFAKYRPTFITNEAFIKAYQIAQKLHGVYWILATHRLMMVCGKEQLKAANQWNIKSTINRLISSI
jgi:hypothetical protein